MWPSFDLPLVDFFYATVNATPFVGMLSGLKAGDSCRGGGTGSVSIEQGVDVVPANQTTCQASSNLLITIKVAGFEWIITDWL
jgi:hypothetical protein